MRLGRLGQRRTLRNAVHSQNQPVHALCQRARAAQLFRAHQRVGDENVAQPGVGHDLGLGHLAARNAARAQLLLQLCKIRRLVRFDVRAQRAAIRVGHLLHPLDIFAGHRLVHDQAGRVELGIIGFKHSDPPVCFSKRASAFPRPARYIHKFSARAQ